ncbi:hypothetical protein B566_EDAN002604 [Ephemera danica]|nr:hypothetical protein B566_EDAN002604 [Ephemera danica]
MAGGERLVRERRRVARILLLLAVLFALCWLPYNILALLLDLDESRPETERLLRLFPFTLLLGHANSAINPLLYCFLTRNFRNTVRQLLSPLCSCSCCPSRRRARVPAASPPLDAYVCSTHRGGRFKVSDYFPK